MRPSEGEASAPDFEKRLEKDPHEADIPDFEGLNVKNEVGRATAHKALNLVTQIMLSRTPLTLQDSCPWFTHLLSPGRQTECMRGLFRSCQAIV